MHDAGGLIMKRMMMTMSRRTFTNAKNPKILPKVTVVLNYGCIVDDWETYQKRKPIVFSIESDYIHSVDDGSVLSAIKHNKEISLVSHFSRLKAQWNPDVNHRFIASFTSEFGNRHFGTTGSFQRKTEIDGLDASIEESSITDFRFSFEVFKVRFGDVEKTFPRSDMKAFLLSILMENDDVDMSYEDCFILEESCFYRLISSTTVFNFEMDVRYLRLDLKKI